MFTCFKVSKIYGNDTTKLSFFHLTEIKKTMQYHFWCQLSTLLTIKLCKMCFFLSHYWLPALIQNSYVIHTPYTVDSKKSETLKKTYHTNRTCFWYLQTLLSWPQAQIFSELFGPRWRCDHFSKKWPKSKIKRNLQ